jgi:hypothetical protein
MKGLCSMRNCNTASATIALATTMPATALPRCAGGGDPAASAVVMRRTRRSPDTSVVVSPAARMPTVGRPARTARVVVLAAMKSHAPAIGMGATPMSQAGSRIRATSCLAVSAPPLPSRSVAQVSGEKPATPSTTGGPATHSTSSRKANTRWMGGAGLGPVSTLPANRSLATVAASCDGGPNDSRALAISVSSPCSPVASRTCERISRARSPASSTPCALSSPCSSLRYCSRAADVVFIVSP